MQKTVLFVGILYDFTKALRLDGSQRMHCLLHRLNPDPADSLDVLLPSRNFPPSLTGK